MTFKEWNKRAQRSFPTFQECWNAAQKQAFERSAQLHHNHMDKEVPCDCGAPESKYNTANGHAMNCPQYDWLMAEEVIRAQKPE